MVYSAHAQEPILNSQVSAYTTASQGDLYLDELGIYYLGLQDGSLKELGIITEKGTANGQLLQWDSVGEVWIRSEASTGDLVMERDTIQTCLRANVQLSGIFNLSGTNSLIPNDFFYNETSASISGNSLTNLEGNVRFILELNFSTPDERTNFNVVFKVNNATTKTAFGSAYGRVLDNHNETSARYLFEHEGAQLSDLFAFDLVQESNSANSALVLSNSLVRSQLFVHQYDTLTVLTDIKSPQELELAQGPEGPVGPQGPQGTVGPIIGSPSDVYHSAGRVLSSGFAVYAFEASVVRTGAGRYSVTFSNPHPNGSDYAVIFAMEQNPGDDDYKPAYTNVTANGFEIEIGEQDNGGSPGIPVDAGFSFYVAL